MEKFWNVVAVLKKRHFWVLSGLAALVGLYAWYSATGTLTSEFQTNSQSITNTKNDLQRIHTTAHHPNQEVIAGLKQQTRALYRQVKVVWQDLYLRQREEVLFWPKELLPDFLQYTESHRFGDELPIDYLQRYQNFVKERFRELPEIVRANKLETTAEGTTRGRDEFRGSPDDDRAESLETDNYLVTWNESNQAAIEQKLVWEDTPSSLKVWVTQEDLWVYETLLKIIARTNGPVTARHKAVVSEIEALEVGQDAAPGSVTKGRVLLLKPITVEKVEDSGMEGGRGEMPAMGGFDAERQIDPNEQRDRLRKELLDHRYLNRDGMPRLADAVDDVPEFKRLPVRMILHMDQREIPKLLTECANATLPVEVQQVRINVDASSTGRGFSESGGFRSELGGPRTRSRPRPTLSRTRDDARGEETDKRRHAKVVIQGIIYIFNPPNFEKVGLEDETITVEQVVPPEGANAPQPGGESVVPAEPTLPESAPAAAPAAEALPVEEVVTPPDAPTGG